MTAIILSALLAFFTASFLVEMILRLFRIKAHRSRATLRLLPFLSIPFSGYPLNCDSCIQKFIHLIPIESIGPVVAAISLLFFGRKVFQLCLEIRSWRGIVRRGEPMVVANGKLKEALNREQVEILVSDEIPVPMALYSHQILIPRKIAVSEEEMEAIIAHEFEHIRWKDPQIRVMAQLAASLVWWVPMRTWMKKIEQEQEMACDGSVTHWGLKKESLASALVKVIKKVKESPQEAVCFFARETNASWLRLHVMLGGAVKETKLFKTLGFYSVCFEALLVVACAMLW